MIGRSIRKQGGACAPREKRQQAQQWLAQRGGVGDLAKATENVTLPGQRKIGNESWTVKYHVRQHGQNHQSTACYPCTW